MAVRTINGLCWLKEDLGYIYVTLVLPDRRLKKPMKRSKPHLPSFAPFCCSYCYFLYQNGFPKTVLWADTMLWFTTAWSQLSLARWRQKLLGTAFPHWGTSGSLKATAVGQWALFPVGKTTFSVGHSWVIKAASQLGAWCSAGYTALSQNPRSWGQCSFGAGLPRCDMGARVLFVP